MQARPIPPRICDAVGIARGPASIDLHVAAVGPAQLLQAPAGTPRCELGASGSSAAMSMSTPMRRIRSGCCARAAERPCAAAPPRRPMKSRRLMSRPAQETASCASSECFDRAESRLRYCNMRSGRCPLWVISGHWRPIRRCPLYPRKRTSAEAFRCPLSANSDLVGARRFWAQRNVFAKASQADVPEAANSSGFKTTISNPPHTEAV